MASYLNIKIRAYGKLCFLLLLECPLTEDDEYRLEVLVYLPNLVRLDKDEYLPEDRAESLVLKQKKEDDAAQKLVRYSRFFPINFPGYLRLVGAHACHAGNMGSVPQWKNSFFSLES